MYTLENDDPLSGPPRGGGGNCPEVLGAPENFLLGPSLFFLFKYFRAKDKISGFFGVSTEILQEKLR